MAASPEEEALAQGGAERVATIESPVGVGDRELTEDALMGEGRDSCSRDSATHGMAEARWPAVSVVVPVLDGAPHLRQCLDAIAGQRYDGRLEVIVVDGGSEDATVELAAERPGVTVLHNPRRSRPAGMNVGLRAARGEIVVRVDVRTVIEEDYVRRCVETLARSSAAIVGGPMRLVAGTPGERGIAEAMSSKLGGGTARFRRQSPEPGPVDTVYLGAYRKSVVLSLGGYDESFGGNEDAELAWRLRAAGGAYLDPSIRSTYSVRGSLAELFGQYFRYGTARARTLRKHPDSISPRQLAVPALLLGIASPWRRYVLGCYGTALVARTARLARRDLRAAPSFLVAIPLMHAGWAVGLLRGLAARPRRG
ncbi:MAG TPA: glycosyltransferase family 2 protein [Acidimicrobiales bacterium]|nr:glycosyltransferase family 2 protein [Acidimicrobiales bacterium]